MTNKTKFKTSRSGPVLLNYIVRNNQQEEQSIAGTQLISSKNY